MSISEAQLNALQRVGRYSGKFPDVAVVGNKPLTTPTAKALERQGLIRICPHPLGWSTEHAVLTAAGRERLKLSEPFRVRASIKGLELQLEVEEP